MHHAPQLVLLDQRQLRRLEKAFEQQDRPLHAGRTQLQRLLDTGHCIAIGQIGQGLGAAQRAMAIGIGLDHRQRTGAGSLAGQLVVVPQGGEVDQGTGGTHDEHFLTVKKKPG